MFCIACVVGGATAEYFDVFSQTGQLFLAQLVVCPQVKMMPSFQYSFCPQDRETVAVHVVEVTAQSFQGDSEVSHVMIM